MTPIFEIFQTHWKDTQILDLYWLANNFVRIIIIILGPFTPLEGGDEMILLVCSFISVPRFLK